MASPSPTWPGPALFVLGLLAPTLAGCGYTLERTSRIEAREQALAAADARGDALDQRVGELETALAAERRAAQEAQEAERRAADDLAALRRRLGAARVQVAALERARVATDAPTSTPVEAAQQRLAELEQRAAEEEARRRALQAEAGLAQQTLAERQQAVTGIERRLQALRTEMAAAEADLADRRRELAGLQEQIARERAGAQPPAGGGPPPAGGRPPR
jgi:DNA repair exonuclease SbcCD ATPase subunit